MICQARRVMLFYYNKKKTLIFAFKCFPVYNYFTSDFLSTFSLKPIVSLSLDLFFDRLSCLALIPISYADFVSRMTRTLSLCSKTMFLSFLRLLLSHSSIYIFFFNCKLPHSNRCQFTVLPAAISRLFHYVPKHNRLSASFSYRSQQFLSDASK